MTHNYVADSNYGIGVSPNKIVGLRQLNISAPDQVTFDSASTYHVRSDLSRVGDGWSTVVWVWDVISIERLSRLLSFLNGADYVSLYIRTDKRDGSYVQASAAFGVYSAIMWKPLLAGQEGTPLVKSPYAMQTVQLKFVNVVLLPGYMP